jgi:Sulfotransferase family
MNKSEQQPGLAPIFIMGCQRSGNTLVSQILDSHPRLAIYHESFLYNILFYELKYYGDLHNNKNLRQLARDTSRIITLQAREIDITGIPFEPTADDILQGMHTPDYAGLVQAMLELYAHLKGKLRGGDKTPENYLFLNQIREHFPNSPIIFLMRDPRDTILSSQQHFNATLEQAAHMWNTAFRSFTHHEDSVMLVRYEELVTRPQQVIQDLCTYIDEPYSEALLSFFQHIPKSFLARRKKLGLVGNPISSSSIGNFEDMRPEDLQLIEAYCNEGMSAMGYEFSQSLMIGKCLTSNVKMNKFRFYLERLRYYEFNLGRWRHGWVRWR